LNEQRSVPVAPLPPVRHAKRGTSRSSMLDPLYTPCWCRPVADPRIRAIHRAATCGRVSSCGSSSCSSCPTASKATATCDGTKCDLKCGGSLYVCNGVCQDCCNSGQCAKRGNQTPSCNGGTLVSSTHRPLHGFLPAGHLPSQAAASSMHAFRQTFLPAGHSAPQRVPSHEPVPPVGAGQGWQALPQ
jgi:hypothetical protein